MEVESVDVIVVVVVDSVVTVLPFVNKDNEQYSTSSSLNFDIIQLSTDDEVATTILMVGGIQAKCCVDTGAGRNYASRGLINQVLRNSCQLIKLRTVEKCAVKVADNSTVECNGVATIQVLIGDKQVSIDFMIMEALLYDCILGFAFCKENDAVINLKERSVRFKFQEAETMRTKWNIEIPAFSEMCVTTVGNMQHESIFLVEQDQRLLENKGIAVARGLFKSKGINKQRASKQGQTLLQIQLQFHKGLAFGKQHQFANKTMTWSKQTKFSTPGDNDNNKTQMGVQRTSNGATARDPAIARRKPRGIEHRANLSDC